MIFGLPYDAEVEYLQSTGTEWIDTGIKLVFPMSCDMTFSVDTNYGSWSSLPVFGLRTSNNNAKFALWCSKAWGTLALNYGSYDSGFHGGPNAETLLNVYNVGAKMYGGGVQICDGGTPTTAADTRTIYLFTLNDNGTASIRGSSFKIANAKIVNGLQHQVDLIPVRFTNEQGVSEGAMYDKVSKRLFRNSGRFGDFVLGPDKSVPLMGLWIKGKSGGEEQ